jgi:hypothetical protein
MSSFISNGIKVKGLVGNSQVIGRIIASRIISNQLMYEVLLDKPVSFRWRTEPVDKVLLSNNEIEVLPV